MPCLSGAQSRVLESAELRVRFAPDRIPALRPGLRPGSVLLLGGLIDGLLSGAGAARCWRSRRGLLRGRRFHTGDAARAHREREGRRCLARRQRRRRALGRAPARSGSASARRCALPRPAPTFHRVRAGARSVRASRSSRSCSWLISWKRSQSTMRGRSVSKLGTPRSRRSSRRTEVPGVCPPGTGPQTAPTLASLHLGCGYRRGRRSPRPSPDRPRPARSSCRSKVQKPALQTLRPRSSLLLAASAASLVSNWIWRRWISSPPPSSGGVLA